MSDTLMLLSGGHPVHRAFGEAIGADFFQIKQLATKNQSAPLKALNLVKAALSIPTGYKYIFCESCYFYPALKRRMGLLGKSKIININGGPILQHILNDRVKGIEAKMLKSLLKEVDGHLVYGEFGREILAQFMVKKPIRIIYPFIHSSMFEKLIKVKPKLGSHKISIIATGDGFNKGLDLLFAAVTKINKTIPNVSVDLITKMNEDEIKNLNKTNCSVRIFKNVTNIGEILSQTALYVQPSRSDMFSISVIEAMACGIPAIVSSKTGTKEIVKKIKRSMVVDCEVSDLSKAIFDYFKLLPKERLTLSNQCRRESQFFTQEDLIRLFIKEFEHLKTEI